MANNNDFILLIQAALDSKGIKSDYNKIKQMFEKDPTKINTVMDMSATKTEINKFIKEYAPQLQKMFSDAGVKGINVKDIETSLRNVFNASENVVKQSAISISKAYNDFHKKNINGYDLEIKKYEENAKIASNQIKAQMLERIQSEKQVQSELKKTTKEQQDALNLRSNKIQLDNRISAYLQENTKLSSDLKNRLVEVQKQISSVDKTGLNRLTNEFKEVTTQAKALGVSGKNVIDQFKTNIGQFLNFFYGAGAVVAVINSFREMISNVTQLDNQLVELSKVSNLSAEGLKKVTEQAYELGSVVGKTGTDALSTITDFVRAGYELQDALDLSKQALMMVNVSENITDAGVAAEDLVHILNGLGEGADYAKTIVDSINEVSNTQAVDFDNLVDGATRLSAVAKQAGVSFQQMLGILTAGYSTLGNMEKVASGAITIFTRLQSIQMDGEENVETVAKLQNDFSNATNGVVNIVDKTTGQLRNAYDILNDLDSVWDSLDKNTQEALAFDAAGTRQKSVFLSIVDNWDTVKDSVKSATDSFGSADEENRKYLDSIAGRLETFKSQYEELSQEVIDGNFLKAVVTSGTDALKVLTQVIDKLGLFPTLLTGISAGLSFKNIGLVQTTDSGLTTVFSNIINNSKLAKTSIDDVSSTLDNYNTKIRTSAVELDKFSKVNADDTMTSYLKSLNGAEASLQGYNASLKTTTLSTVGLKIASVALNAAMTMGIAFAIQGLISMAYKYANAIDESIKKANELTSTYQESINTIGSNIQSIEDLRSEFDELSKGVDENGNNVKLSTEQYARYREIVEQIVGISPSLVKGYDAEGNALVNNNTLLQDAINLQKELNEQKKQEYLSSGEDVISGARGEIEKLDDKLEALSSKRYNSKGLIGMLFGDTKSSDTWDTLNSELGKLDIGLEGIDVGNETTLRNVVKYKEKVIALATQENDLTEQQKQELVNQIDLIDVQLSKIDLANQKAQSYLTIWASSSQNSDWYSKIDTGFLDDFNTQLNHFSTSNMSLDEMQVAIKNLGESFIDIQGKIPVAEIDEWQKKLADGTITENEFSYRLASSTNVIRNLAYSYKETNPQLSYFLDLMADSYTKMSSANSEADKLIQTNDDINSSISDLTDTLSSLSKNGKLVSTVKDEIKEVGSITSDTINSILTAYPQLSSAVEDYLSGKRSEKDLLNDLSNAYDADVNRYQIAIATKNQYSESFYDDLVNNLPTWVQNLADAYQIDLEQFATLYEAKAKIQAEFFKQMSIVNTASAAALAAEAGAVYNAGGDYKLANDALQKAQELQKLLDGVQTSFDTNFNPTTFSSSKKDKTTSKEEPVWLTDYKTEKADIDHQVAMEEITQEEYYTKLEKLNNDVYANHKKDFLDTYRSNQEEIYKGRKAIDEKLLEEAKKAREDAIKSQFDNEKSIIDNYDKAYSSINDLASSYDDGSTQQLEVYTKGIAKAKDEISYLQQEINKLNGMKNAGYFADNLDLYDEQLKTLTDALYNAKNAISDFQESISKNVQSQLDNTTKSFEDSYEKQVAAIEKQRDAYADIINSEKELLDLKEKQRDYEKDIADKTKDISKIESRMSDLKRAASTGDRAAQAELNKLSEDVAGKKDDLAETQHDHEVDLQKDALDKALDDNNKLVNQKLEDEQDIQDKKLDDINVLYQKEMELIAQSSNYTKEQFATALNSINTDLAKLGVNVDPNNTKNILDAQGNIAKGSGNEVSNPSSTDTLNEVAIRAALMSGTGIKGDSDLNKHIHDNYGSYLTYSEMVNLAKLLKVSGISKVEDVKEPSNRNKILQALKKKGFTSGGTIGKTTSSGSLGELLKLSGENVLIPAKTGEGVLTEAQNIAWLKLVPQLTNLSNVMTNFKTPDISSFVTNKTNNSSPIINFNLNGGTITQEAMPQFNQWKKDIISDIVYEINKR